MEGYVIEFASRAGEFLFRQRLTTLPATVGRALSCDFIVDDPYVAARHFRLEADPAEAERVLVTDLGSRNGLLAQGRRVHQISLACGETVSFGHTTLRLRHIREDVAPERLDQFSSRAYALPAALTLFALALLSTLAEQPFEVFDQITPSRWLTAALGTGAPLLIWAALWALIGRVFAGRAQSVAHLAVAGWAFLAVTWGTLLCNVAAFALSLPILTLGGKLLLCAVAVWALHRHLSLAQLRRPRLNLPLAALLVALPVTFTLLNTWKNDHRLFDADTLDQLYDPALRVTKDHSLDQFMSGMAALRERANRERDQGRDYDENDNGGDNE